MPRELSSKTAEMRKMRATLSASSEGNSRPSSWLFSRAHSRPAHRLAGELHRLLEVSKGPVVPDEQRIRRDVGLHGTGIDSASAVWQSAAQSERLTMSSQMGSTSGPSRSPAPSQPQHHTAPKSLKSACAIPEKPNPSQENTHRI